MIINILKYIRGYLLLKLSGYAPERFMNLCVSKGYLLWNIKKENDQYMFNISLNDYREIKPLLKKTNTKATIIGKYGLPFFLYTHRKRKVFILGLLASLVIIYILSLYVWDIEIKGSEKYTNNEINKYIEENYVYLGKKKSEIDCKDIEFKLREHFDNIAWISCELKGTQFIVEFKETLTDEKVKTSDSPCDLVAAKDGIVTSMITRYGTPIKKIGDEVKKGDILISGVVNIYDDSKEVLETNYVSADGDICGRTIYEYSDSFPINYYDKEYTGKEKHYFELLLFGKLYNLYAPKIKYVNYDIADNPVHLHIGKTFYLPLCINCYTIKEYTPTLYTYTKEEAFEKANIAITKYADNLIEKGVEIVENNVTIDIVDDKVVSSGHFVTVEPIAVSNELKIDEGDTNEQH